MSGQLLYILCACLTKSRVVSAKLLAIAAKLCDFSAYCPAARACSSFRVAAPLSSSSPCRCPESGELAPFECKRFDFPGVSQLVTQILGFCAMSLLASTRLDRSLLSCATHLSTPQLPWQPAPLLPPLLPSSEPSIPLPTRAAHPTPAAACLSDERRPGTIRPVVIVNSPYQPALRSILPIA